MEEETGKVTASDGVFQEWPQISMTVQMLLGRLPPTSGQRRVFVLTPGRKREKKALDQAKTAFEGHLPRVGLVYLAPLVRKVLTLQRFVGGGMNHCFSFFY